MTLQDCANAWIGSAKVGTSELLEGTEISLAATSNDTLSFYGPGSPRSILTGSQQFAPLLTICTWNTITLVLW